MDNAMKEKVESIVRVSEEIKKLEEEAKSLKDSIKDEEMSVWKLVKQRLCEREKICKEFNPKYNSFWGPAPVGNPRFHIRNVEVKSDYSVEFEWSNDCNFGFRGEGDVFYKMALSKDEFLEGDFSKLKEELAKQFPREDKVEEDEVER